jgi:hypothetical protein
MAQGRVEVGAVFSVPVDEQRIGFGQVAAKYRHRGYYYFVIFDKVYPLGSTPSPEEVVTDRVAFLALSMDAKLAAGHWAVIGDAPVRRDLPLPAYKETVGAPGHVDVVDYTGERRRPAAASEAELLPNRSIVAPVRLENALRALHGVEPWHDAYDKLRPTEAATTARLFG